MLKFILVIASVTFSHVVFARNSTSEMTDQELQRKKILSELVVYEDGPNCFNASLFLKGFIEDVVYISSQEVSVFLNNYCKEQQTKAENSLPGELLVFADNAGKVQHTAVTTSQGQILEKQDTSGNFRVKLGSPKSTGRYLTHSLSKSPYSAALSKKTLDEVFDIKVYQCQTEDKVKSSLETLRKDPLIETQLQFRKTLSQVLKLKNRKKIENEILQTLVPAMKALLSKKPLEPLETSLESDYLYALNRSNAFQVHALICSKSLATVDECYAPHLQNAEELNASWYEIIYAYEKQHGIKSY